MEFHFLRPYWLLLLFPMLIIIFLLLHQLKQSNHWQKVIDPNLLQYLFSQTSIKPNYRLISLLFFIWSISIFALAGPTWEKREQPVFSNSTAKVILLDLSQSMLAQDIKPNRLTRAKYKILDILRAHPEGQTGLAVFSSEAYTVSPLTNDVDTIALMVPALSPNIMPVQGNDIGAGLRKAEMLLRQGEATTGTIILITDSVPNSMDDSIAKQIHSDGYDVSILAIGTQKKVPLPLSPGNVDHTDNKTTFFKLNFSALEKLAQMGGGRFSTFTNTDQDVNYLLAPTLQKHNFNKAKTKNESYYWYDEGRWFILLIMPFVLLTFRRGWLEQL